MLIYQKNDMKIHTTLLAFLASMNLLTAQLNITVELKGDGWDDPTTYLEVVQNGSTIATYTDQSVNDLSIDCNYPLQLITNGDISLFGILDSVIACEVACDRFQAFDCMTGPTCEHTTTCANLPLEWVSFDGTMTEEGVRLTWVIATPVNVQKFIVERSDVEFIDFRAIGEVVCAGLEYAYHYFSHRPAYYRVTQYDHDGAFEHSQVIFVDGIEVAYTTYNLVTGHLETVDELDRTALLGTKRSARYGLVYLMK